MISQLTWMVIIERSAAFRDAALENAEQWSMILSGLQLSVWSNLLWLFLIKVIFLHSLLKY